MATTALREYVASMQLSFRRAAPATARPHRVLPGRGLTAIAVVLGLGFLTPTAQANQHTYGFYCEFVGGSIKDALTRPYEEIDPFSFHKPEMRGSMTLSQNMTDLLPDDPTQGYYEDNSGSNLLTFMMEGQQMSFLGNICFTIYVDGSSYLSVYDDSFRLNFLFHDANFANDSVSNLQSLPTNLDNDVDFWALTAFGGGNAYSDLAANVWRLNGDARETSGPTPAAAAVPDTLPLLGFVIPLLAVVLLRGRAGLRRV